MQKITVFPPSALGQQLAVTDLQSAECARRRRNSVCSFLTKIPKSACVLVHKQNHVYRMSHRAVVMLWPQFNFLSRACSLATNQPFFFAAQQNLAESVTRKVNSSGPDFKCAQLHTVGQINLITPKNAKALSTQHYCYAAHRQCICHSFRLQLSLRSKSLSCSIMERTRNHNM